MATEGDQLVFKTLLPPEVVAELEDAEEAAEEEAAGSGAGAQADGRPVIAGTLRTPRGWERLLVDARVIGGRERWREGLRGL